MGYLQNSNAIVEETTKLLDDILQSKSTVMVSGMGEPVIGRWWNMNDSLSTADNGTQYQGIINESGSDSSLSGGVLMELGRLPEVGHVP